MRKVIKRDGRVKDFDSNRIVLAVDKASDEINDKHIGVDIALKVTKELEDKNIESITVEEIQDMVVDELKSVNINVATAYQK